MKQYILFRMPDGDDTATATVTETTTDSTGNNSNSGNAGDSGITNNDSGPDNSGGNTSSTTDPSTTNAGGGGSTDDEGFRLLDSGSWNGAVTKNYQGGQVMHFKLKNVNVLGTTITLNSNLGGKKSLIILPQQTSDMRFDCFGREPMSWTFDVSTDSDAFIVAWSLYSSWLPGDPPNG